MSASARARVCANVHPSRLRLARAILFNSVFYSLIFSFFFFFLFLFHRSRYLHVILGTIRVCRSLQPAENALVSAVCLYIHTWKPTRSGHLFRRIRRAVSIFRGVSPSFAYRLPASRVKNDANLSRWSSSAILWRWILHEGNNAVYFSQWSTQRDFQRFGGSFFLDSKRPRTFGNRYGIQGRTHVETRNYMWNYLRSFQLGRPRMHGST